MDEMLLFGILCYVYVFAGIIDIWGRREARIISIHKNMLWAINQVEYTNSSNEY